MFTRKVIYFEKCFCDRQIQSLNMTVRNKIKYKPDFVLSYNSGKEKIIKTMLEGNANFYCI